MGLITERGMERLSFESRLLRRYLTPFEIWPAKKKEKVPEHLRQDFLAEMVKQLVARRKELGLSGLAVDARVGSAEYLTAKWECGMRSPSAFMLQCWARALGCRWALVPIEEE